jgi:putative ATP-dependent endonuclease of OLD family
MYLHKLHLCNFRKYGIKDRKNINVAIDGSVVQFQQGLNLLISENNSSKTDIIDALKRVYSKL